MDDKVKNAERADKTKPAATPVLLAYMRAPLTARITPTNTDCSQVARGFGDAASRGKLTRSEGGDDTRYFHANGIQTIRATSMTPTAKTTNPTL